MYKPKLGSSICRDRDLHTDWYRYWAHRIGSAAPPLEPEREYAWGTVWAAMQGKWKHRKLWEWCAISQALDERGMLKAGKHGIGFAVGREPLASLFATSGATILATDLVDEGGSWSGSGQMAASKQSIHWPGLIAWDAFDARAQFASVDMRKLGSLPRGSFDFAWSSCSFEHLGSLEPGLQFVRECMDLIRPGGIAVHTTEVNLSSNDATLTEGEYVIYRKRDIENLDRSLRLMACGIEALDFDPGSDPADLDFDRPPYYTHASPHLKLSLEGHITTSIMLIVRKAR